MYEDIIASEMKRVLVFIESYSPTEAERALAEKHSTKCFVNSAIKSGYILRHRYVVAVDPKFIPEGYTVFDEKEHTEAPKVAPVAINPNSRKNISVVPAAKERIGLEAEEE